MVPDLGGFFQSYNTLELRLDSQTVEDAVPVRCMVVANRMLYFRFKVHRCSIRGFRYSHLCGLQHRLNIPGIPFLERKLGSDFKDKHSLMYLSLDSSIAKIIDILACSLNWGRNGRFKTSTWNTVAREVQPSLVIRCNLLLDLD